MFFSLLGGGWKRERERGRGREWEREDMAGWDGHAALIQQSNKDN